MNVLDVLQSQLIAAHKEKEVAKKKYIEECQKRGISDTEIEKGCAEIERIVEKSVSSKVKELLDERK